MGFFDRFKKRVKEVVDETDLDELTAEEGTQEAEEAVAATIPLPSSNTGLQRVLKVAMQDRRGSKDTGWPNHWRSPG